jgi:hypothetical protein
MGLSFVATVSGSRNVSATESWRFLVRPAGHVSPPERNTAGR